MLLRVFHPAVYTDICPFLLFQALVTLRVNSSPVNLLSRYIRSKNHLNTSWLVFWGWPLGRVFVLLSFCSQRGGDGGTGIPWPGWKEWQNGIMWLVQINTFFYFWLRSFTQAVLLKTTHSQLCSAEPISGNDLSSEEVLNDTLYLVTLHRAHLQDFQQSWFSLLMVTLAARAFASIFRLLVGQDIWRWWQHTHTHTHIIDWLK